MRDSKKQIQIQVSKNDKRLQKLVRSQIPLSNDVFMIFAKSKKFCQEFLRVILQDKKLVVLENDIQKHLPSAFNKNTVLDMLCRLGDNSIVNVEIQLTKEKEHAKRIFTYASKIKNYLTEKGAKYKDLKDIIEIYLTKEDIFKKGSTVYEVEMNIVSDQNEQISKWDAGLKVYYVNTEGLTNKNINEYLKMLTDKQESVDMGDSIVNKEIEETIKGFNNENNGKDPNKYDKNGNPYLSKDKDYKDPLSYTFKNNGMREPIEAPPKGKTVTIKTLIQA